MTTKTTDGGRLLSRQWRRMVALGALGSLAATTAGLSDAPLPPDVALKASVIDAGGGRLESANVVSTATLGEPLVHPLALTGDQLVLAPGYIAKLKLIRTQSPPVGTETPAPTYVTRLDRSFPNPFNPATTIRFSLAERRPVSLRIHDARGRVVRDLVDEEMPAGVHEVRWDGTVTGGGSAASGVYFLRLRAGDFVDEGKLILLK